MLEFHEVPPRIQDRVQSAADLDRRATVGTIVEDADGDIGRRVALEGDVTWQWADCGWSGSLTVAYPVTVVRVGTSGGDS